jgi:catechol 2,3-dioxygenase-like lactoylglutathione lyase family enzyme
MTISTEPIMQICWVTADLDASEAFFGRQFGVKRWTRIPDVAFGPDTCTYRGAPADFVIDVSLSYLGDLQLELIRPVRGASIYADHLDRAGAGMHHVCVLPADFDAAVAAAEADGVEIAQRGSMAGGAMRFAYVDGTSAGAAYIELAELGPPMLALFASIKEQCQ